MKKTIALLLTAMILTCAVFTGCGKKEDNISSAEPATSSMESSEESQEPDTSSEVGTGSEDASEESEPAETSAETPEPSENESSEDAVSSEESSAASKPESKPESKPSSPSSQPSVPSSEPSSESTASSEPSSAPSESAGVSASAVYSAINSAFQNQYGYDAIPGMTMEVDDTTLTEKFRLTSDMVESYAGAIAAMMTNCDELLVVQAKEGQIDNVKAALEQALADQKETFGWYAVMNNTERLEAAKVVVKGNYAALLIVGTAPDDVEDEGAVDFSGDVSLAENAFYGAIG